MELRYVLSILLVTFAGLSTLIGSFMILTSKNKSHKKLGFLLGLATGIMVCIVIKELLPESIELLNNSFYNPLPTVVLVLSLLVGVGISILLERVIHHHDEEEEQDEHCHMCNLGLTTAFTFALHKFPEGIAIFIAIYDNYLISIPLALAIAIHHIPEGMIISAPIYYGTGNKKKALLYSLYSGLVLPVSGLIGFFLLKPFFNDIVHGVLLAITSSIMFYITFKEIMPHSLKYGNKKTTVFAIILGIIFIYLLDLL